MAEETNAGLTVFVADITSMWGSGSGGAAALLSACSFVRCCSQHLSYPVLRCCFRALLHFVRSATKPSQEIVDVDSLRISLLYSEYVTYNTSSVPKCPDRNLSSNVPKHGG